MSTAEPPAVAPGATVAELGEEALIALITPMLPHAPGELVGSGDDCAVLALPDGCAALSTDVLVEGRHFRAHWSTGHDVGRRAAAQNLADAAAMGALPTALVVGLVMPPTTTVDWVRDFAAGLAAGCRECGAGVVGGDLSAGESLMVAVTVVGDLQGRAPVLRSGARPGDAVVHVGTLGRSAAGWALLEAGLAPRAETIARAAACLDAFRAPRPPLHAGPALAAAGASSMMDVSDSLLRDAGRIARASSVVLDLGEPEAVLGADVELLEEVAAVLPGTRPRELARWWVLTGGEDHGLLATVPQASLGSLPDGARVIGRVREASAQGPGVLVGGRSAGADLGWDHFG